MTSKHLRGMLVGLTLAVGAAARAQMGSMPMDHAAPVDHAAKVPSTPSTSLTLSGAGQSVTLSPADLQDMPRESVSVVNGHSKKTESYSGVPIAALLAKLGLPFEKANEHTLLQSYLVAKGTDGYIVVISAYEALSAVHEGTAIVADTLDGKPLGPDGAFKLILSGDKRPQRWVRNLASLTLQTTR